MLDKGQLVRKQSLGLLLTAHQRLVTQLLHPAVPLCLDHLSITDVHLKAHRQGAVTAGPSERTELLVFSSAAVSCAGAFIPGC